MKQEHDAADLVDAVPALPLRDQWDRPLRDLRLSVIDRCNFRCSYCMPKEVFGDDYAFLPPSELLSFDEMERLIRLFALLGVKKIRLTGGEPLLRQDLPRLIERLVVIPGIEDVAMTTNGVLLDRYMEELHQSGLRRLNISLDALDAELFKHMNGRSYPPTRILHNIKEAKRRGFKVRVNMVVQRGVNDHEIIPMARYFKEQEIDLCLIEFMDVGNDNGWDMTRVVTKREMIAKVTEAMSIEPLEARYYGEVAARYRYHDSDAEIHFISSVSESFCSTCTRARVSSDGKLFTCLFASSGFDLREELRAGASDAELLASLVKVWSNRKDRYSDERSVHQQSNRRKIDMSYIGG
ncbi:GTP 3',8-cyclase MoaA [Paenibacillus aquistagni]|uniref:GTP 3',8-cyclase MoaA n=1 Tax=Paenibacillus aquistagni TaxID=1852522 RepID=UPI000B501427|nr:GTP 3',8-cyclase MoaA [Paenibacillus aquistagni]